MLGRFASHLFDGGLQVPSEVRTLQVAFVVDGDVANQLAVAGEDSRCLAFGNGRPRTQNPPKQTTISPGKRPSTWLCSRLAEMPALVSRKQLIGWGMDTLSGLADKGEVLRPFAETPQRKRPPGGPNGMARPGAFINCCPSVLECGDAVVCSEVPTFRYELALGQAEQEMAEHGRSAHCP